MDTKPEGRFPHGCACFPSSPWGGVSVSRFAARPVGAHSMHFTPLARSNIRIEFTSVVLPTPGPPVLSRTRLPRTVFSASRWLGASVLPVRCSHHAPAFSYSIGGYIGYASARVVLL